MAILERARWMTRLLLLDLLYLLYMTTLKPFCQYIMPFSCIISTFIFSLVLPYWLINCFLLQWEVIWVSHLSHIVLHTSYVFNFFISKESKPFYEKYVNYVFKDLRWFCEFVAPCVKKNFPHIVLGFLPWFFVERKFQWLNTLISVCDSCLTCKRLVEFKSQKFNLQQIKLKIKVHNPPFGP